jgi:predicted AlkP superfamily pyrophosphatase or phosphodiesterase
MRSSVLHRSSCLAILAAILLAACATHTGPALSSKTAVPAATATRRVIVFVWDGMRPDSISEADTPHLAALARRGTWFTDNHSSYPTLTMMNAAAFASGAFSGKSGFYGNEIYRPGAPARTSSGSEYDLDDPVFTEDVGILKQLDANQDGHLLLIGTLFQAAQRAGLRTAAVGKVGPAFLQDYKGGSILIDEKTVLPLEFAHELQAAHYALPADAPFAFPNGGLRLAAGNGDPTFRPRGVKMTDKVTVDPSDAHGSPPAAANRYLMSVFLDYILPQKRPDLAFVWLRNPDTTEHDYGPGSPNYHDALKAQDDLLGKLEDKLAELGLAATTDLIVVSDHGHSTVSGPLDIFPLRAIVNGKVGAIDREHGYSVSGQVRLADELARAGIRAYDGGRCLYDPVMSGILANGTPLHPDRTASPGSCPDYRWKKYTTPDYQLPHPFLPREAFVIATNGGSDYLYQPAHDPGRIRAAVRFLQSREEFGAIFVDSRYGDIPGTLPLSTVRLENAEGRNPDIVVGYAFDEHAIVQGMPGIEFRGTSNNINRGSHGSFSPIDVHNTLLAAGPDFREQFNDPLPSGNVDVAPTIARILGLQLPQADGRPLLEALRGAAHVDASAYVVTPQTIEPSAEATGLLVKSPTGADTGKSRYTFDLRIKQLRRGDDRHLYFDFARARRD